MNFDLAFNKLLKHEGGFSDHALDRGGKTKYGITEAVAREVGYRGDMQELPLALAKKIYKDRYWDACQADKLPSNIRYIVFDGAVNSGLSQSVKWLQKACGITEDGIVGSKTIQAANADEVKNKLLAQRLRFMTNLSTWTAFGKGWTRRICDLMEE